MTARHHLRAAVRGLVGSRDLLWTWTERTVKARYQQSLLGWLWAVVQPAAQVAIFTLVFTLVVPVDTGSVPYVVFAYAAMTPWVFFSTAVTDMASTIVDNLLLVTKIYFPREVLPLAALLARFFDFLIASLLLIALVVVYGIPVSPTRLLLLPLVVTVQIALTAGLGLAAAAANTFVRDVRPLLLLLLQLWFYLSPIIYPIDAVPAALRTVYSLNPMVGILDTHRAIWLGTAVPTTGLITAALTSAAMLAVGYVFFKRSERLFPDIA